MSDKVDLLKQLIAAIYDDIERQKKLIEVTEEGTQSAAEVLDECDTGGLESLWLAKGLAKRLDEKEKTIEILRRTALPKVPSKVEVGSIVAVSEEDLDSLKYYFVVPVAGGYKLQWNDIVLTTVTPESPLGKLILGKQVGDEVSIVSPKRRVIVIEEVI